MQPASAVTDRGRALGPRGHSDPGPFPGSKAPWAAAAPQVWPVVGGVLRLSPRLHSAHAHPSPLSPPLPAAPTVTSMLALRLASCPSFLQWGPRAPAPPARQAPAHPTPSLPTPPVLHPTATAGPGAVPGGLGSLWFESHRSTQSQRDRTPDRGRPRWPRRKAPGQMAGGRDGGWRGQRWRHRPGGVTVDDLMGHSRLRVTPGRRGVSVRRPSGPPAGPPSSCAVTGERAPGRRVVASPPRLGRRHPHGARDRHPQGCPVRLRVWKSRLGTAGGRGPGTPRAKGSSTVRRPHRGCRPDRRPRGCGVARTARLSWGQRPWAQERTQRPSALPCGSQGGRGDRHQPRADSTRQVPSSQGQGRVALAALSRRLPVRPRFLQEQSWATRNWGSSPRPEPGRAVPEDGAAVARRDGAAQTRSGHTDLPWAADARGRRPHTHRPHGPAAACCRRGTSQVRPQSPARGVTRADPAVPPTQCRPVTGGAQPVCVVAPAPSPVVAKTRPACPRVRVPGDSCESVCCPQGPASREGVPPAHPAACPWGRSPLPLTVSPGR